MAIAGCVEYSGSLLRSYVSQLTLVQAVLCTNIVDHDIGCKNNVY